MRAFLESFRWFYFERLSRGRREKVSRNSIIDLKPWILCLLTDFVDVSLKIEHSPLDQSENLPQRELFHCKCKLKSTHKAQRALELRLKRQSTTLCHLALIWLSIFQLQLFSHFPTAPENPFSQKEIENMKLIFCTLPHVRWIHINGMCVGAVTFLPSPPLPPCCHRRRRRRRVRRKNFFLIARNYFLWETA